MGNSNAIIQYLLAGVFIVIMIAVSYYIYATSDDPQNNFRNDNNDRLTVTSSGSSNDRRSGSLLGGGNNFADDDAMPSNETSQGIRGSNYSGRQSSVDSSQDRDDNDRRGWIDWSGFGDTSTRSTSSSRDRYTDWPAGATYTRRTASRSNRLQRGRWDDRVEDDEEDTRSFRYVRDSELSPDERLARANIDQTEPDGQIEAACILADGTRFQCSCLMRLVRSTLTEQEMAFIVQPDYGSGPASRLRQAGISFDRLPDLSLKLIALDTEAENTCNVGLPYSE